MNTQTNELKTLTKHISCKCKCKFYGRKCNSKQKWNNDKCWCECKNIIYVKKILFRKWDFIVKWNKDKCLRECKKHSTCEKDFIGNPAACSCKYLANIMDASVIMCDEIIDVETKTIPTNFNEKKQPAKHKISVFYLHFY